MSTVILVAHGSRDPRAASATRALARAVAATVRDWRVRVAFLEVAAPSLAEVLAEPGPAIVMPLLLTPAYHARVDIPSVLTAVGSAAPVAPVLGPDGGSRDGLDLLVGALRRRLDISSTVDGLVLGAAGSRDPRALASVDTVAAALGSALGVPSVAGYASGAGWSVGAAVAALRDTGARSIAMAAHFLAPGRLYDRARTAAIEAGVDHVAEPLTDASELVALVRHRTWQADTLARFAPARSAELHYTPG
jgi:sirohydrochlorin ferrochelatase